MRIAILAILFLLHLPGFSQETPAASPEKLFEEATSLYNEGNYEEAAGITRPFSKADSIPQPFTTISAMRITN